jgi:hypothetical protein
MKNSIQNNGWVDNSFTSFDIKKAREEDYQRIIATAKETKSELELAKERHMAISNAKRALAYN